MDTWDKLFMGLIAAIVALGMFFFVMCAKADGKSDFCYVGTAGSDRGASQLYEATAHRPWRPDVVIGYATTLDGAVQMAKTAGCTKLYTQE